MMVKKWMHMLLESFSPLKVFEGYVIAQISRSDDVEFKLVVSKNKGRYNKDQVEALVEFQERFYKKSDTYARIRCH